ncbi:MAG: hypothetical protein EXS48_03645 [Candidatus Staskawiczbacteria bacterium]|nr:hypothetical protein [Candidatus Staskawiczbacteria bacterium]
MQVTPRIYQVVAIKAAVKGLRGRQKRALVVLATGLGKTLTVAFITQKMRPKRALFLVHNNFILKHAIDEFQLVFDKETNMATYNGMSKDGAHDADIVFATWQTMGSNLKQWKRNHFDLVIVDEAHHSEAETYKPVVEYFSGAKLGITATPNRSDDANIRDIFGDEVINITLEEAIARGWLPRIEYHVITDESLDDKALQQITQEIRESKKRFTMAEINRRIFIKKRDAEIARIINGYSEKAVVFCASIHHAEGLRKSLKLSAAFHSKKGRTQEETWDKNQATLENLKNGLVRRVCAVNAFNEGVNVPSVGLVAFCRVTGALTIFRQQLGRGLRPGKDKLIVLDFVGNLERIQLVLETMNKISDLHEQFTPREDIDSEGYVRQKFEVSGSGFEFTFSDKVVDLMKILEHCEREFYPTWQEASEATIALGGIGSMRDYEIRYKEDDRLPSSPISFYADFPDFSEFFGVEWITRNSFYKTWQEASRVCKEKKIVSGKDYRRRYKSDFLLPSAPERTYPDFPGWNVFLGNGGKLRPINRVYPTLKEATMAVRKLNIKGWEEYRKRYKEDEHLPSNPNGFYKNWKGWRSFLGTTFYPTVTIASRATIKLGVQTRIQYSKKRRQDPMLPSNPNCTYKEDWVNGGWSWPKFLGKE